MRGSHEETRTVDRRLAPSLAEPRMINLGVLLLAVFSGLRPGTNLVAVLALLKTSQPPRPLVLFIAAGLGSSWVIGLLVVGVFDGTDLALGGSTFAAVLNLALGAAALAF